MSDLQMALVVAYRHFSASSTTESERDAILGSMAEHFSGQAGETASRSLHHRIEQRKMQLQLAAILEGIGEKPARGGPQG